MVASLASLTASAWASGRSGAKKNVAASGKYIDAIPGVTVKEDVANWIQNEALKRMETLLQANPKIDVVYAHNDPMAIGAYWAAKNAGREHEMIFIGVDGLGGEDGGIKRVMEGDGFTYAKRAR